MDGIVTTFKKLRHRVSPQKQELNAPSRPPSKLYDLHGDLSSKRQSSDPFDDRHSRKKPHRDPPVKLSNDDSLKFIRDSNLRSAISRDRSPAPNASESASDNKLKHESESEPATAGAAEIAPEKTNENHHNDEDIPLEVLEEMHKLEECFPVLALRYRLLDKIGEGTFSTVYKAEAVNGAVVHGSQMWKSPPLQRIEPDSNTRSKHKKKNPLVALKQIYVTSSPNRIYNELNLLYMLSGNAHVAPLLDILRYQDQVLAILPFYEHADFRDFYRDLSVKGIKKYMWELLHGLEFVHSKGIMHRDMKPTNFLYDPFKGKGVLVDFGLAEKVPLTYTLGSSKSSNNCPCMSSEKQAPRSHLKRLNIKAAYPKLDQRPPRRANRAGTRGFRAPEVLLKCTNQSTKIDIWSAGIIGLSLLSRKFPLFNSPDDIDAIIEIILIFGAEKFQKCAELHGCGLEINMKAVTASSFNGNLVKLLSTVLQHEKDNGCFPEDSVINETLEYLDTKKYSLVKPQLEARDPTSADYAEYKKKLEGYTDLKHLLQLLYGCFSMDPSKRLSAESLLALPFFNELKAHKEDDVVLWDRHAFIVGSWSVPCVYYNGFHERSAEIRELKKKEMPEIIYIVQNVISEWQSCQYWKPAQIFPVS